MSRRDKHNASKAGDAGAAQAGAVAEEARSGSAAEQETCEPAAPDEVAPEARTAGEIDPLVQARNEAQEWKDKCLRALAEVQNALRRAANEREDAVRYANGSLLRGLLEVVDDFERALAGAGQCDSAAAVLEGVKLVHEKLLKFLRDQKVEAIEAEGTMFDPSQHEAMMQQPSAESAPGTVLQQLQRGYRLHERLLRPAKVIVAAAPPENSESQQAGEQ